MSPYERERRSNVFRGGGVRLPDGGNAKIGQRDSEHLAVSSSARRPDTEPAITDAGGGARLWVNHGHRGACEPALNPRRRWEDPRKKGQGFKPDSGNPTVRDYRGASGNVATVEMRSHLATERAGMVTLHLQADAPEFYPNPTRKEKATPSWP
jgi:hypothetical protein